MTNDEMNLICAQRLDLDMGKFTRTNADGKEVCYWEPATDPVQALNYLAADLNKRGFELGFEIDSKHGNVICWLKSYVESGRAAAISESQKGKGKDRAEKTANAIAKVYVVATSKGQE